MKAHPDDMISERAKAANLDPNEGFFSSLPEIVEFAEVVDQRHYSGVPESWYVVLTDVRGSTKAIEAGRYKDVNALGVASIVALRNAIADLELPYVFGGDGATMLVPGSRLLAAEVALRGVQKVASEAFDLELRVGAVPVAELYEGAHPVRVLRYRASAHVCLAMLAGSGFTVAESWLKDPDRGRQYAVSADGAASANLDGFECRWQPVESRRGEVVSLLVSALSADEGDRALVYRQVIAEIERVVGGGDARPVSIRGLRLGGFRADYSTEARLRSGRPQGEEFDAAQGEARKKGLIGRVLMGLRASAGGFDGATYKKQLVENSDFRKFDETLRMVLDLSSVEIAAIASFLDQEHAAGRVAYGMHRAPSALVTCFVRSYAGDHVHFIDGANGGYALAAKQMKAQLALHRRPATPSPPAP